MIYAEELSDLTYFNLNKMSEEAHGHGGGEHHEAAEAGHGAANHGAEAHGTSEHHEPVAAGHGAANHGAEAHAPAAAHKPAHTAPHAAGPTRDKSPIGAAFSKAQMEAENAGNSVIAGTTKVGEWIRKVLRAEVSSVKVASLIKTPFYVAGHALDATVLNAGRRAIEAVEPVVSGIRAFCRLTIGNILHPLRIFAHPIERIAKPAIRMITSATKSAINQVKAPVRAIDDLADRGINRITQQVNHQISRIPVLGKLFSTSTNWITKQISHLTAGVRRAVDFVTSPIDVMHEAAAPA